MSISLQSLRQETGQTLNECIIGSIDASPAPATTYVYDDTLMDICRSASSLDNAWLLLTSGTYDGQERVITAYDQATGKVTFRALAGAPTAADTFEIHRRFQPSELDRLINDALETLYYLDEELITPVSSQRQYSLATYTWLTEAGQVVDVLWRTGTTASQYRYQPAEWSCVRADGTTITLDIEVVTFSDGEYIVLRALHPYVRLTSDADTTACPESWAKAAAIVEAYRWLVRNGPAQDVERYERSLGRSLAELTSKSRAYAPRPPLRPQFKDTPMR